MANTADSVADIRTESFPDYQHRIDDAYIKGYDPVSLAAPHSSLNTHTMWIGMGLILASLFGVGLAIWGAAGMVFGAGANGSAGSGMLILGLIEVAATWIGAFVLMKIGRRGYNEYRTRTGRLN